ncbi:MULTISPECIES: gamma-glutamylcyclotransferase [Paracoccus]|uniref:glutathione-specific gamma-glutamylcyclotransferase n=1 Tax=Paracoccus onubensis TaxID=1675788 RepID=A0A418SMG7_9RHOB|nr:gamma-glutamylcyclotransferase [Paracoccus onubensis]MDP0930157.1 gamma-glutamylcyclotransferase [Paracoccus onubensis]RJE82119.1 gamma-glutamylcyclotransferase [Paracoccus onubensis]
MEKVFWVFGYGSLMWDPGFNPVETVKARLSGYSRSFCLRSITFRGTHEAPGLVLGLDEEPGAECRGLALRIAEDEHSGVMEYLRARELASSAYREMIVPLHLEDGREIHAIAYVMRRDHWQYAGGLCTNEQADIIARAHGGRGPNADYLFNTVRHLAEIGMNDEMLEQLSEDVRRLMTDQA